MQADDPGTFFNIGLEMIVTVDMTGNVVEGVIADGMATRHDLSENIGIFTDIVANDKEGGFDAVMVKHIKHPRCYVGDGSVIESEINRSLGRLHPPLCAGIEPP